MQNNFVCYFLFFLQKGAFFFVTGAKSNTFVL